MPILTSDPISPVLYVNDGAGYLPPSGGVGFTGSNHPRTIDPVDEFDKGWSDWIERFDKVLQQKNYADQVSAGAIAAGGLGLVDSNTGLLDDNGKNVMDQMITGNADGTDNGMSKVVQETQGTSGETAGTYDLSSILGSSAFQASQGLQAYYEMYQKTGDAAYLEKLIDNFMSLENMSSAREYEKMMSDTAFSRLVADIEHSGYNPWLALQDSISQASSANGVAANVSSISSSSQQTSRENNENTVSASRMKAISSVFSGLLRLGFLLLLKA